MLLAASSIYWGCCYTCWTRIAPSCFKPSPTPCTVSAICTNALTQRPQGQCASRQDADFFDRPQQPKTIGIPLVASWLSQPERTIHGISNYIVSYFMRASTWLDRIAYIALLAPLFCMYEWMRGSHQRHSGLISLTVISNWPAHDSKCHTTRLCTLQLSQS